MTRLQTLVSCGLVLLIASATGVDAQTVRSLPLRLSALVAEPVSGRLYGALPPTEGAAANSVVAIDPVAGTAGVPVFVGSDPRVLAPSSDGQFLWVGLGGASAIRRVDIGAGTAGPLFPLVRVGVFDQPEFAQVILPVPGSPGTIVVGQGSRNSGGMESFVVYDQGVARPSRVQAYGDSIVAVDATTLLVTTSSEFLRLRLDPSGLTVAERRQVFPSPARFLSAASGLVYAEAGAVYDATTLEVVRVLRAPRIYNSRYLAVPEHGRFYHLEDGTLVTRDLETYDQLSTRGLPTALGGPSTPVVLGGGLAYYTNLPSVVLFGDFAAPPPMPLPHPMPGARVELSGCTTCRAGDPFIASVTFTNPSPAPVRVEVKGRILNGRINIPLFGAPHGTIDVRPGTQTVTVLQGTVPATGVAGSWLMEIVLVDPVSGRTYSTSYRSFFIY